MDPNVAGQTRQLDGDGHCRTPEPSLIHARAANATRNFYRHGILPCPQALTLAGSVELFSRLSGHEAGALFAPRLPLQRYDEFTPDSGGALSDVSYGLVLDFRLFLDHPLRGALGAP
jgi:hypothetical protein